MPIVRPFVSSLTFARRTQTRKRFSLNIVGPWEIKFLFWSAAVSDLSFEITIFQQCFMHIYPFRSEESTENGSRRQMSKKMVENGESAAIYGKCNGAGVVA